MQYYRVADMSRIVDIYKIILPIEVSERFRDMLQECFSTIWDSTVYIAPDPTLPVPTQEQMEQVLNAIQEGYDKEYNRNLVSSSVPSSGKERLTVDMLDTSVQVALVQAFIKGIAEYKQEHLPDTTDVDTAVADRLASYGY